MEALDEDGPEPDDRPPALVNELHLVRHRGKAGGALKGRFDDAAMFDAIATVIDAHARPDGLRRAIAARDRGCAGCGRPPSWCEVHHVTARQDGGDTALHNCVMLCRACHRLQHHSEWEVRIRDGLPELIPPAWIDPQRRPRRRPLLHLAA
ncbi:HNH endonuclease signature motif containing protein [Pseudonocardia xinjiangensis]|uniref:HNH endonuclease n=1 Tax=Pseudonocardia xinjiangensis TaxID=75289 RepID=UPI0031CF7D8E